MTPRRQIRDILAANGMDPVQELIDLVKDINEDKAEFKRGLKEIRIEELRREAIRDGIELDKVKLRVLQVLNDATQREDDQAIKLAELEVRKQAEADRKKLEGGGKVVNEYIIPAYGRESGDRGRMIRLERGSEDD